MTNVSLSRLQARQRRYAIAGTGCVLVCFALGLAAFCFWLPSRSSSDAFATILVWAPEDVLSLLGVPFKPSNETWSGTAWLIGNMLVWVQSIAFVVPCIIIYKRKYRLLIWYMAVCAVVWMATSAFVNRYGADALITRSLASNKYNSNARAILPASLTPRLKADLELSQRVTTIPIVDRKTGKASFAASIAKSTLLQYAYIRNDVESANTLFLSFERNAEQDYGMSSWRFGLIGEWLLAQGKLTEDDLRAKKVDTTMLVVERLGSRIAACLALAIGLFAIGLLSLAVLMLFRLRRIGKLFALEQQTHLQRRAQKMHG
jgi:hypothetical protein